MSLQRNRQCAKDREGHAKDNVQGMKWKQVPLLAGFYSPVSFFPLSPFQEFFSELCCSEVGMLFLKHPD